MPAPVNGTITLAPAIMSPSCSTPLRRSGAIMQGFAPADSQRCASSQLCKAGRPFAIPQGIGLLLRPAAFLCRLCNQKVVLLLAGLDFPRQPSGGAAPAAP